MTKFPAGTGVTNDEGLPIIPPLKKQPERPPDGAIAICGVCGLRLKPVMNYACPRSDCPCFAVVTCRSNA